MEKKRTAVEKLELMLLGMVSFDSEELRLKYKKAFEKSKEMEKEQIIDAIVDTQKEYIIQASCYPPQFILDKAFNYYKERFNNK
jgi:hypothetical protein